ncbi:hypothetical protein [Pelagibius marinus]|uniref:hypothetical protein n=1 Tax=Pelagibius marinus TaxID=2762760 RepID=UPI0018723D90|nr:hypothetical protein [Pelagibius marinus]
MLRTIAAVSALSVLVLVLAVSFSDNGNGLSQIFGGKPRALVNTNTGEPLTLRSVQNDVEWHRETARKLRELD